METLMTKRLNLSNFTTILHRIEKRYGVEIQIHYHVNDSIVYVLSRGLRTTSVVVTRAELVENTSELIYMITERICKTWIAFDPTVHSTDEMKENVQKLLANTHRNWLNPVPVLLYIAVAISSLGIITSAIQGI